MPRPMKAIFAAVWRWPRFPPAHGLLPGYRPVAVRGTDHRAGAQCRHVPPGRGPPDRGRGGARTVRIAGAGKHLRRHRTIAPPLIFRPWNSRPALRSLQSDPTDPSRAPPPWSQTRGTWPAGFNIAATSLDAAGEGLRFEAADRLTRSTADWRTGPGQYPHRPRRRRRERPGHPARPARQAARTDFRRADTTAIFARQARSNCGWAARPGRCW